MSPMADTVFDTVVAADMPMTRSAIHVLLRGHRAETIDAAIDELLELGVLLPGRKGTTSILEPAPLPSTGPVFRFFDHDGYRNIACTLCLSSWVVDPTETAIRLSDRIRNHPCVEQEHTR
jgi:hypothetical protein